MKSGCDNVFPQTGRRCGRAPAKTTRDGVTMCDRCRKETGR